MDLVFEGNSNRSRARAIRDLYQVLSSDVRSFDQFKFLHLGMLSERLDIE